VPEILVASPLRPDAVSQPYTFPGGISIRALTSIRWDVSIVKSFISERERREIENTRYWLCASREVDRPADDDTDDLYELARYALWTTQIICPSGAKGIFLKFWKTPLGYDNVGSLHPREMEGTLVGRMSRLEDLGLARHFGAVHACVKRAFEEKVVRLQNPILLIEHAMQSGNTNLGALMAVMGLDMLLMAGNIGNFVSRLGGCLGPRSPALAPPSDQADGPVVTVQEVVGDLYEFRNIIAHGNELPEAPWRLKYDLLTKSGSRVNLRDYYYAQFLRDCAIFFVTRVLRQAFVDNMFDDVKDVSKWKTLLKLYEHRWRDQATVSIPTGR
jgi:hypothetical protein